MHIIIWINQANCYKCTYVCIFKVQHKRTALLQTPVVQEMWHHKWRTFGQPVFVINISLYISFLALLTAAVLAGPFPQDEMCNGNCYSCIAAVKLAS